MGHVGATQPVRPLATIQQLMKIYATINVPTATSHVGVQSVQWTADGQLCLTTKAAAYIMTPDHGISFDTDSVIRHSLHAKDKDSGNVLGWFRTMIQFDKSVPFKWTEYSQEWATLSLGLMDLTLCTVVFSPSGLSSDAGCVAATLSSNMDFCLWMPVKNFLKGEWKMIYEVTPYLVEKLLPTNTPGREDKAGQILKAQIVSITWSQQCGFGHNPSPMINGSLLVAGNRAGSLLFFRFLPGSQIVDLVGVLDVSDRWVTHVSITSWNTTEQGRCMAYLAYGTTDGSIGAVRLTQQLSQKQFSSQPLREYEIALTTEKLPLLVYEPDESGITALQWMNVYGNQEILVHCTPGRVHLHYPSVSVSSSLAFPLTWHTHSVRLESQRTSTASSALHPPSGINYLHTHDRLILTLSDGSINVLQGLGTGNPRLVEDASKALSTNARAIFVKTEREEVDKRDMNKITGMADYDLGNGTVVWSHEVHRPGDFSYQSDAKQKVVLVVANLWEPISNDTAGTMLLGRLEALRANRVSWGQSPLSTLRPIFFSLRDGKMPNAMYEQVLALLNADIPGSDNMVTILDSGSYSSNGKGKAQQEAIEADEVNVRRRFRQSVKQHLFGWDTVANWRLRLGLADYIWHLSDSPEKRAACGLVAENLLTIVTRHILRTLVKHMLVAMPFLAAVDVSFACRLSAVVQSLLGDEPPPDLINDAQQLVKGIEVEVEDATKESCPACGAEVPLKDIRAAVCSNGHVWTRCSVTTFVLSTAFVRTCVGCKRKAFVSPSAMATTSGHEARLRHLPAVARCWVVEELLEAAQRCLFCGNAFVCIV